MIHKKDIDKLRKVFSRYPEVKGVYLFGSRAVGAARRDSDFDLACCSEHIIKPSVKLKILKDLTAEGFDNIDLVMLAGADPVVRYEAVRLNKLVYSTEDFDRGETYSRIIRAYFDLLPYLNVQRQAYKQRKLYAKT